MRVILVVGENVRTNDPVKCVSHSKIVVHLDQNGDVELIILHINNALNTKFAPYDNAYLRNGTEIEDTLIANSRHVGENIRNVLEGVGNEDVETRHSLVKVTWHLEVRQFSCIFRPCLRG